MLPVGQWLLQIILFILEGSAKKHQCSWAMYWSVNIWVLVPGISLNHGEWLGHHQHPLQSCREPQLPASGPSKNPVCSWWGVAGTCWVPGRPFALHRSLSPALMEPHSPQQGFSSCSFGCHIPRLWHSWTHDFQLIVGNFRGLKNVAVLLSSSRAQEQTCRSLPKTLTVPKAVTQSKFW